MLARVTTVEGPPERMDDATRFVWEQLLPQLQQLDGFKGFSPSVIDRAARCLA